ncbi:MAG: hypothetical protein RLY70_4581, partial [Planctomycetota bacterium]
MPAVPGRASCRGGGPAERTRNGFGGHGGRGWTSVLVVKDPPRAASRVVKEGRFYGGSLMASTSTVAVGSSSDLGGGSRSGDEIALAAASSLRAGPYPVLRNISCRCESGQLTLTGAVGSFYLKQIAQTIVARVPGVGRIDNRL